ncbi:neprilysin-1-like [Rhipicephalus microplus]|uniref:neprilysin-1-like n=1 Tax=Rhipicephalus microplus TaxID=6941 RepID=UPI003F6BCD0E
MYTACMSFAESYSPETADLVEWMQALNMDFLNQTKMLAVNPVEMMVRGSLDLGIEAVLVIYFQQRKFISGKRIIEIDYSTEHHKWRQKEHSQKDYKSFLAMYGVKPPDDYELAERIRRYEAQLEQIADPILSKAERAVDIHISDLGQHTAPYVTSDQWATYISKYTNGTYTGHDYILHWPQATKILVNLFQSEFVGEEGLQYLVAWSIYRQLVLLTEPYMFLQGRPAIEVCYKHIMRVMNLAIMSPFFKSEVPLAAVDQAKIMVSQIVNAFKNAIRSGSWISSSTRSDAINTLNYLKPYVGSPGRRLEPGFVEQVYKQYPDAPLDRLFPTWIKALSLSSHDIWIDPTYPLYNDSEINAYYSRTENSITIPTAIMQSPLMYSYGPLALNYGSLGMIIAHELMHAFDVEGIKRQYWPTKDRQEYTRRALCLRRSHKSVLSLSRQHDTLNDILDSENIADLVGTVIAYAAFAALSPQEKNETLAGLDMSPDQLFFVSHCVKWCSTYRTSGRRYAPYRSRCLVPLMNMPEFSRAFGCSSGTPMNPPVKCTFW